MEVLASLRTILANTSLLGGSITSLGGTNTIENTPYNISSSEQLHPRSEFYQELLVEFWDSLYTHRQLRSILLICLYVPVFLVALVGNVLVLLVVLLHKHMRNVTNGFIVNLAVADLLVTLVCIPTTIGQAVYKVWVYGEFMCKVTGYMQGVSVASSVFTIMLLSIDRYLAIRHPMTFRTFSTTRHAAKLTLTIWLLSLSIMVPLLVVRRVDVIEVVPGEQLDFCNEVWAKTGLRQAYDIFLFSSMFVLPGLFVTASYSRLGCRLWTEGRHLHRVDSAVGKEAVDRVMAGRRKVARMLVVLAILFASCWMPYHLLSLYLDFLPANPVGTVGLAALPFALWLGHANSAFNPILYCFLSASFRRTTWRMVKPNAPCRCWRGSKRRKVPTQSPVDLVVHYKPLQGSTRTVDYTKRPLVRVLSGSSTASRTSGSLKLSRSSNTSFRSSCRSSNNSANSNNLKIQDLTKRTLPLDVKREGDNDIITVSVHHNEATTERADDISTNNLSSAGQRQRREIFSYTLNIPTTINEESSRTSSLCRSPSPRLENLTMVRAICDVGSDVTHDVMRCDSDDNVRDTFEMQEKYPSINKMEL